MRGSVGVYVSCAVIPRVCLPRFHSIAHVPCLCIVSICTFGKFACKYLMPSADRPLGEWRPLCGDPSWLGEEVRVNAHKVLSILPRVGSLEVGEMELDGLLFPATPVFLGLQHFRPPSVFMSSNHETCRSKVGASCTQLNFASCQLPKKKRRRRKKVSICSKQIWFFPPLKKPYVCKCVRLSFLADVL